MIIYIYKYNQLRQRHDELRQEHEELREEFAQLEEKKIVWVYENYEHLVSPPHQ